MTFVIAIVALLFQQQCILRDDDDCLHIVKNDELESCFSIIFATRAVQVEPKQSESHISSVSATNKLSQTTRATPSEISSHGT